jgi:hypothetical protein
MYPDSYKVIKDYVEVEIGTDIMIVHVIVGDHSADLANTIFILNANKNHWDLITFS